MSAVRRGKMQIVGPTDPGYKRMSAMTETHLADAGQLSSDNRFGATWPAMLSRTRSLSKY